MEQMRKAFHSISSAFGPYFNWNGSRPVSTSQAETLNKLVEEGKTAADNGKHEEAVKLALQALVGAREAKDWFLLEETNSPYTKQQLADWFGTIAYTFNTTGKCEQAARCFYTATVFDGRWTVVEHGRVSGVLWGQIMQTKIGEPRANFQSLLTLMHEVEQIASLAEHFHRWEVAIQISMDIFFHLDSFVRITKVGARHKRTKEISRECLLRVARCSVETGNHQMVKQFCHKVLEDFGDYNDPVAFEIWGRSLMKVNDYTTAKKKIQLALENAMSKEDVERLEELLKEIDENLQKPTETTEADPEWLAGTEAKRYEKLASEAQKASKETPKKKTKHRRPKARERQSQLPTEEEDSQKQPYDEENVSRLADRTNNIHVIYQSKVECADESNKRHIETKTSRRKNKRSRRRHGSNDSVLNQESDRSDVTSIISSQLDLSDFDSDSNDSEVSMQPCSRLSNASSTLSLDDLKETQDDDSSTFYEQSCRFHCDSDYEDSEVLKYTKLLREGLQLNMSFLQSIKGNQKKEKNESFYEIPLDKTQCEQRLMLQPKKFKRCTLKIEGSHLSYCTPVKAEDKISVIEISGRSKAGRTFNEDEVVVEILDAMHEDKDKRYGKVVGILNRERHKDVAHPVFVCTLDDMESHLVRPMCKTVPKINILHNDILKRFYSQRKNKIELHDYNHRSGTLELAKIIDINPADRHKYVFLVAYLQWERQQYSIYPVGAVIRILPCGNTIQHGLDILDLQYEVPSFYAAATVQRLESITRRQQDEPPETLMSGRCDLTGLDTFTIDPPGSKDLDDALSIEEVEDGYRVGVHIADVTVYVIKDDAIDKEACDRAVSFYPGMRRPRHMLPEPFSQNICSLIPNKRRLCISVFHNLDAQGNHNGTEIKLSVIKSRRQFTYAEVQEIINASSSEVGLSKSIKQLFGLAEKRRKRRLGNSMFALALDTDDYNEDSPEDTIEAHYLVEEFMVLTNWKIAKQLVNKFPDLVPQRCQQAPSRENLDAFMKNENSVLNLVLKLQGKNIFPPPSLDTVLDTKAQNNVIIQKWLWDLIDQTPEKAARFIKMDELHPLQYLAYQHWLSIQEHAFYKCSGSLKGQEDGTHYSLGCMTYTHFTSPIRRYIDIVVHRLVHCMLKKQKVAYTADEVEKVCLHVNSVAKRAKSYEKGCKMLKMAISLKTDPKTIVCFTDDVNDSGVSLCAPELKFVAKAYRGLRFNLLDMGFKPTEVEDTSSGNAIIQCKWRKRLYDYYGIPALPGGFAKDTLCLDQHPGMMFVPAWNWAKILKCAIEERKQDLRITASSPHFSLPSKGLEDINTEAWDITRLHPNTVFCLSFTRGQALKIQMTAEPQKGMLAPKPQLFNITKSFKCCLQHTDDPVMHLAKYSTKPTLDQYKSVKVYLDKWVPLVIMEAAVGAVSSEDTCSINNVPVKFRGRSGKFSLPISFCELRNIEFGGTIDEDDEDADINKKSFDFLCLKHMISVNQQLIPSTNTFWVGHAEIMKVFRKKSIEMAPKVSTTNGKTTMEKVKMLSNEGKVIVSFDLHPLSPDPPMDEADSNGLIKCGVEILIKSEVDRRTETFLKMLPEAESTLVEKIALNNKPFDGLDEDHSQIAELMERDLFIESSDDVHPLPKNNKRQQEAIDKALGSTFTLIQGPPGTGKTYTGIKLMYLFNKINKVWQREGHKQMQVLFCGPSNKSVDLVARWMIQRMGPLCPKIVRVYGRSIEAGDFPIPGKSFLSKRSTRNAKADEEIKSVSLHHLIREKGKPFSERINAFDKRFKEKNYEVDPQEVKKYLKIIREASVDELKKHEVILCTTAVASNPKIRDGTDIFQMIIDEAGMCPEPQCLAPIIANKPEQVVLIGDHKQLRPIIMCKEAAELGLQTSLFEKYWLSKSAQRVQKIMLDIQYRMNPQICRFPSETFYNGKLKTSPGLWCNDDITDIWPLKDGRSYPHVLIHVEGEEKTLTVSTEDGNEQSKSNDAEIEEVVRVYKELIDRQVSSVNIISQYNAQCSELRKRLETEGFSNFKVNTVVSSQGGEWDYVIFSTVRSLPEYKIEKRPTLGWCKQNLGFITDQNQINVALTRARKGLIIIGNTNLLRCDEVWGKLVKHYDERGCIKKPGEFPRKRTRQEKIWANIEKSEQRYGDEMFIKGELPELGPYVPAQEEENEARRREYRRSASWQQRRSGDDGFDDSWQQQRSRRKGRY